MILTDKALHAPSIGNITYPPGGTYGPRPQRSLQLVYLYSGSVEIDIDNAKRSVRAQEATLLLPGHREFFRFDRETSSRHGWVQLAGSTLSDELRQTIESLPEVLPFSPRMYRLVELASANRQLRDNVGRHRLQAFVELIMLEFLSQARDDSQPYMPRALREAYSYIEQNYADPCPLDVLAEVGNVSKAHLIRLFRQHLSTTPAQALWEIRLENAEELLRTSGLSVKEIAAATGFQTSNHLSRRFRQRYGAAPIGYRQEHWQM